MGLPFTSAPPGSPHVYTLSQGMFHLLGFLQVSGLPPSACVVIRQAKPHHSGSCTLATQPQVSHLMMEWIFLTQPPFFHRGKVLQD